MRGSAFDPHRRLLQVQARARAIVGGPLPTYREDVRSIVPPITTSQTPPGVRSAWVGDSETLEDEGSLSALGCRRPPSAISLPERRQRPSGAVYRPLARVLGDPPEPPAVTGRPCAAATLRGPRGRPPTRCFGGLIPGHSGGQPSGPRQYPARRVAGRKPSRRRASAAAPGSWSSYQAGRGLASFQCRPRQDDEQNLRSGREFAGSSRLQARQCRTRRGSAGVIRRRRLCMYIRGVGGCKQQLRLKNGDFLSLFWCPCWREYDLAETCARVGTRFDGRTRRIEEWGKAMRMRAVECAEPGSPAHARSKRRSLGRTRAPTYAPGAPGVPFDEQAAEAQVDESAYDDKKHTKKQGLAEFPPWGF